MNDIRTDHRRAPRISINRSAKLIVSDREIHAKLLDISLCGSGILCSEEVSIDQEVTLHFSLPNYDSETPLTIYARVARTASVQRQFLVGVEFAELDLHQDLVIKGFISYHERFQNH